MARDKPGPVVCIINIDRIRLEVEEENTRAASLYERLGYEKLDYKQMIKDLVD